ncbi:hypothetical protein CHLRE_01g041650v5 [Chlamydomonas reinhardtii]|uniref:Uncharacterized protein n=1 Tax=Chlamydomonas reinhardtii TaxID=3055 RepID=A0A2K3E7G2_CHLRE|nr:uncharacterized protein CHLRE_01g041650v5 [Chlamydomonas reinhardtii]PNW88722.1 hypothetical protein CHLRE_01g041650v5 [Chlamydomonas reinhardtii]
MQSRLLFAGSSPQILKAKAPPVPCRVVKGDKRHGHRSNRPTTASAADTGPNKAPVMVEAMVQAVAAAQFALAMKTKAAADAQKAAADAQKAAADAEKAAEAAKQEASNISVLWLIILALLIIFCRR